MDSEAQLYQFVTCSDNLINTLLNIACKHQNGHVGENSTRLFLDSFNKSEDSSRKGNKPRILSGNLQRICDFSCHIECYNDGIQQPFLVQRQSILAFSFSDSNTVREIIHHINDMPMENRFENCDDLRKEVFFSVINSGPSNDRRQKMMKMPLLNSLVLEGIPLAFCKIEQSEYVVSLTRPIFKPTLGRKVQSLQIVKNCACYMS